jgi:hypothetical protein
VVCGLDVGEMKVRIERAIHDRDGAILVLRLDGTSNARSFHGSMAMRTASTAHRTHRGDMG